MNEYCLYCVEDYGLSAKKGWIYTPLYDSHDTYCIFYGTDDNYSCIPKRYFIKVPHDFKDSKLWMLALGQL